MFPIAFVHNRCRFGIAFLVAFSVCCSTCMGQFIVAHRGASYDAPENTLAAFRLAWEQEADAIEGDFYLTADKQIVCIHDKTTKRVAPTSPVMDVAKSTLEDLRKLDVGSWKGKKFAGERTPTLAEVLATVPDGKRIFIEIKCGPEIVPVLKKQLKDSGLKDRQIVIIAFNKDVVRKCRLELPQYKCNWLTSFRQNKQKTVWTPTAPDVVETLLSTEAAGLGTNANVQVVDDLFIEQVRKAGCECHVWTVNQPDVAKYFGNLGVDSITTDRPKLIRSALRSK